MKYQHHSFEYTPCPVHSARVGRLSTPHGIVDTPNFIFCATKASIKSLLAHQVKEAGAEIILSNTYHLMIQPGIEHIGALGGLHKFMNWDGPMLTDSGGYQVFAMGHGSVSSEIKKNKGRTLPTTLVSIEEDGVMFKSYHDGTKVFLSPEIATRNQIMLGADLFMQFDECTPFHVDKSYTRSSMHRSLRWGARCLEELPHHNTTQAIYGIVQGGVYQDLRTESAQRLNEQNFFGNAIGGSLGADKTQMQDIVAYTSKLLAHARPLHLLGIGDIPDIFWGVRTGIDTFDCVHPTRIARHGVAIVPAISHRTCKLNLKNSCFSRDADPIDSSCTQPCCTHYTRAYIHHLFKAKELLGYSLLTMHNISQISRLMREIRSALQKSIIDNTTTSFDELEKFWLG